jgi:four helix bundle protein
MEAFIVAEGEKVYNIKHRAFYFSKDIIEFIGNCKYEKIHFSIFDQLLRSSTSIGTNLVEGIAGSTKKDFINYYRIALKSANETKYWLCLIRETLNTNKISINNLLTEADELSKIIASIIVSSK